MTRTLISTLIAAVIGTGLAITVNIATEGNSEPWSWIAVAVLSVTSAIWATFAPKTDNSDKQATGFSQTAGDSSQQYQAGGNININHPGNENDR